MFAFLSVEGVERTEAAATSRKESFSNSLDSEPKTICPLFALVNRRSAVRLFMIGYVCLCRPFVQLCLSRYISVVCQFLLSVFFELIWRPQSSH